jgi:hypothetical protein
MLSSDNHKIDPAALMDPSDLTIGDLLVALADHKDRPLVFRYDGRPVKTGYHVTEVKAGQFAALDCEANPESWSETFIQLWDVDEGGPIHMPAGKFAAIIRKVSDHVALDHAAKLTFEVSDGVRPMELHRAARPKVVDGAIEVELTPRPASCKPRDRWLREQAASQPCCGASTCC